MASICEQCGLCCSGSVFAWVPAQAEEIERLRALGFPLEQRGETTVFPLGCTMLDGTLCRVYPDRPATCRAFRCEVLRKVDRGDLSEQDALDLIGQAKALLARVEALLDAGEDLATARALWRQHLAADQPRRAVAGDPPRVQQLLLHMTALNLFLDRHFRTDKQQFTMVGD